MKRIVDISEISSIMFVQRITICISTLDLTPASQNANYSILVNNTLNTHIATSYGGRNQTRQPTYVWWVTHRRLVVTIRL